MSAPQTNVIATYRMALPINPSTLTTAQEKGVRIVRTASGRVFPTFFKKKKLIENERVIEVELKKVKPYQSPIPLNDDMAVHLSIDYYFPHPSGTSKATRTSETFMTRRPDVDNISKSFIDVMTKMGFWEDDSQLQLSLRKFRSPNPRVEIQIDVLLINTNS